MDKVIRTALAVSGVYLAILLAAWIWFNPYLVSERIHKRISIGASAADVERLFGIRPYNFPGSAYCGKNGPARVTRIAIDETGRMPLFPLPMAMVTTTIFCFDRGDKLVGMTTERWVDAT